MTDASREGEGEEQTDNKKDDDKDKELVAKNMKPFSVKIVHRDAAPLDGLLCGSALARAYQDAAHPRGRRGLEIPLRVTHNHRLPGGNIRPLDGLEDKPW